MQTKLENDKLTIYLEGRINSNNAGDIEREIRDAVDQHPGAAVAVDAEGLAFISSAGLRVLLNLRKRLKKPLPVLNVSAEVYEIFDVTGFTDLLDVRKRMREVSVEGLQEIGSGANGKVYRLTQDEMIKVFRPGFTLDEIETEREASRRAFLLGVPCAIAFDTVKVGECYGTIYEMLNAATLVERIRANPERLEALATASARLLKELHATEVPTGTMLPADRAIHGSIDRVAEDFTPDEVEKLHALFNAIPRMNRFVHNDYHAKNVMETGEGELMLIDLGEAGEGSPLLDLIHCYLVYNLMGSGTRTPADDEMSFIGLTYGENKRFWKAFGETYFGSAEKAEAVNAALHPYGQTMYIITAMAHPLLPKEYHPAYVDKLRAQVLSQYDALLGSLDGILEE